MDVKCSEFDSKYNILDAATPRHTILSARYKRSFAYYTMRERLPVIVTQIIDSLTKDKDEIAEKYEGEGALKKVFRPIPGTSYNAVLSSITGLLSAVFGIVHAFEKFIRLNANKFLSK